jgi:hypothetical protein
MFSTNAQNIIFFLFLAVFVSNIYFVPLTTLTNTHSIIAVVSSINPTMVEATAINATFVIICLVAVNICIVHTQKNSAIIIANAPGRP